MIQFDLTNAESFKTYFLGIAESNKLLNVNEEPYLYGKREIGVQEAADWNGRKLWAWPTTRARGSSEADNPYFTREATIWIGGPCTSELLGDEDIFYFECEKIVKQVISKLLSDYTDTKLSTSLGSYIIDRADMVMGATKFIGCELVFTFNDPNGVEFDADDWDIAP